MPETTRHVLPRSSANPRPPSVARGRKKSLLLGTALSAILGMGYGRGAYASGPTCTEENGVTTCTGGDTGIDAQVTNAAGTGDLSITVEVGNDVVGDSRGIYALQAGTGDLSIMVDAGGVVTGGAYEAIYARRLNDGAITITANGTITSGTDAIFARHYGEGKVEINVAGEIISPSYGGVNILHNGASGSIVITTNGEINSGGNTIRAAGNEANANVDILISVGEDATLVGGRQGIYTRQIGSGAIDVKVDGDLRQIPSIAGYEAGIFAWISNTSNSETITITTGASSDVVSERRGISAYHYGLGDVDITVNGYMFGESDAGIYAMTSSSGAGAVSITTGAESEVTGGVSGIDATHAGVGPVTITTGNLVTGGDTGIDARMTNAAGTGELSITVEAGSVVTGDARGIFADQGGAGELTISVAGTVQGDGPDGVYGIMTNRTGTGTLSITTETDSEVTGGGFGVRGSQDGLGALVIEINGDVNQTATTNFPGRLFFDGPSSSGAVAVEDTRTGVYGRIRNPGNAELLSITISESSTITSERRSLDASHYGIGGVNVVVDGTIINKSSNGFDAILTAMWNNDNTEDLTIVTGANSLISSEVGQGIRNFIYGSGDFVADLGGTVISRGWDAVTSFNFYGSGGQRITVQGTAIIEGDFRGIYAASFSSTSSALNITVAGAVTGARSDGIGANNYGTAITIDVLSGGSVTGANRGIYASNSGTGGLSITAGGMVDGGNTGIEARIANAANTAELSITVEAGSVVTGGETGIVASHARTAADPTDEITITVGGEVRGGTDAGISTVSQNFSSQTIEITATGEVTAGSSGFAIQANAGYGSSVTLNNAGTITGAVSLTNSNVFTNTGTWKTAGLTSDFNATGNSLVVNEGLIVAAIVGAGGVTTTTLTNLDVFRNSGGGSIRLANGLAGDVFRVDGDFEANGGVVELDVVLDGDGSATDRLVVDGDVRRTGASTGLLFSPVGGVGALTDVGILVVQVGGSSDEAAFVLANTAPLEMGAFVYDLSRGNCATVDDENWYLCSMERPAPPPGDVPPPPRDVPPQPVPPSGELPPKPETPEVPSLPLISSQGAVFESMPSILLGSFGRMHTLSERTQQRTAASSQGVGSGALSYQLGPWVRVFGDYTAFTPMQSDASASWNSSIWGIHLGIDAEPWELDGGNLITGAYLRIGGVGANISNDVGRGRIDAEGIGIGATLTWYSDTGFYTDVTGSVDQITVNAQTVASGPILDGHLNQIFALSAEVGQRFSLVNGLTVVPQAQLSWSSISDQSFIDAFGNSFQAGSGGSLVGRVGLAVEHEITDTTWGDARIYGFGNILHDFNASRSVSYAGVNLRQTGGGTWGEIGTGISFASRDGFIVYAQGSYRGSLSGVLGHGLSATLGLERRW
jgi:outer membrane autotransporter protein